MSHVFHIASKELREYFNSVLGWVSLTLLVFITGVFYWIFVSAYATESERAAANPMAELPSLNEVVIGTLFSNIAVIFLFVVPLITMRLLAEERRNHTLEFLMTAPVSSGEIVVGKFLGSLGFLVVALALTAHYPIMLFKLGNPDLGPVLTAYLGALLLGGTFVALGLLASSFTQHQLVAGIIGFVVSLLMWVIGWFGNLLETGGGSLLTYLSFSENYDSFVKGFVKLESVVYFLSCMVFFLFATQQRLETMRRQ
jgi:ABC-2 type transport system permease protein